jgi:alpha-tubulin suppressor-like RCC1 family protein
VSIKTDGTLWTWGSDPGLSVGISSSPVQIGSATNWSAVYNVSSGNNQSTSRIARTTSNALWGWGKNNTGHLFSSTMYINTPTQMGSSSDWSIVAFNGYSMSSIKTDATMWGAGNNFLGQIRDNSFGLNSPVQIASSSQWNEIMNSSCASEISGFISR